MKVFIDTNVLIDYINRRNPYFEDSATIVGLCVDKYLKGVVSSLTIINCMYVARKIYDKESLFAQLNWMLDVFKITPIDKKMIKKASVIYPLDFEDAVQFFSAKSENVDCIITRDESGFNDFDIPKYTPTEFIRLCKEQ